MITERKNIQHSIRNKKYLQAKQTKVTAMSRPYTHALIRTQAELSVAALKSPEAHVVQTLEVMQLFTPFEPVAQDLVLPVKAKLNEYTPYTVDEYWPT